MRNCILWLFVFCVNVLFAQKPEWIKPSPIGRSLFVQGLINDKADSTKVLSGNVVVSLLNDKDMVVEEYLLKANSLGVFQFHLKENAKYSASFQTTGYIVRRIDFDTHDVPEKAWKKGCDIYLNIQLDERPEGFKDMVAELPFATFKFDIDERIFLFDLEETNRVAERYEEELSRARAAQSHP
jgi:hypothetical protein